MNNNTKAILVGVLVLLVGLGVYFKNKTPDAELSVDNSRGCYVANLSKDVYTLNIQSQIGDEVSGILVFKNFEKDSSSGPFVGTLKDGILLADYTFQSEGMTSKMKVIFKKQGNAFLRGYGEMNASGDNFADLNKITFDTSYIFQVSSGDCATSLVTPLLKDDEYCYTYNHQATTSSPYTVSESMKIKVAGVNVTGSKTGNQAGPDMTNGYEGTLVGVLENDVMNLVFSYVVEGSHNMEAEIYKVRSDQTGLEKLRYPLTEGKDMLIPDTTKPFQTVLYSRVGCQGSN